MSLSTRRVRAIYRKELREYRRNGGIVRAMVILPLVFVIPPMIQIFGAPSSSAAGLSHTHALLYMLAIPALVPAFIAAYAVVGERQQGTLEPVLGTPVRREEFLLGKALAVLTPSLMVAYGVYVLVLICIKLFADPAVAAALVRAPDVLAQVLFTPLIACFSTWVGISISTRASEVRVAQQLSTLVSLPSVLVTSLIAYNVIHASLALAAGGAALLLVLDSLGWRVASALFDRERLITSTR
jgi:ABC-2 type transport system permease protein